MRRFLPRSLAAQMLLLLGAALLVAQLVNFALILNERQKLSLAQNESPAIDRFAQVASDLATAAPEFQEALLADASRRGASFELRSDSGIAQDARDADIEARLTRTLLAQGIASVALRASLDRQEQRPVRADGPRHPQRLLLGMRQPDGRWLLARLPVPAQDRWLALRLGAATLLVYIIVLGASIWAALRLARPLQKLTHAADAFGGRGTPAKVEPSGPADLRRAIEAFNAMNDRVVALLDEKDRMLGALGHDLRTPLASLRIRLEAMGPEEDREAAIAKVADISEMLEEILVLAKSGRTREAARRMDVGALVEALVVDQQELGRSVRKEPHDRIVADVQPTMLRRAVTNLIDNAVKYAGDAVVSIKAVSGKVEIGVSDRGPGIPKTELENVLQAFYRVESSRNRGTGGAGLGLPIARSIAQSHGGELRLEPASPDGRGLIATLSIVGADTGSDYGADWRARLAR